MKPYRAVIFDLYHTLLYEVDTGFHERAADIAGALGVPRQRWAEAWRSTLAPADRGDFPSLIARVRESLARAGVGDPDPAMLDELAGLRLGTAYPVVYPDTRPALAELRRRGYRTGLISNIAPYRGHYLTELELDRTFDALVLSYQVRMLKPDPAIYQLAAARLGVPAQECVFVDDLPAYVAGAQAVGMAGVLVHRVGSAAPAEQRTRSAREPDLEIERLDSLLDWLPRPL